jgi:tetratricopeptide (TPR) repeat protein
MIFSTRRRLLLVALMAAPIGCARMTTAERITTLEAQRAKSPQRFETLRDLGIVYYKENRPADARSVLQEASRIRPNDGVTALYLGLSAEATGDIAAARAAYSSYLRVGRTARVRRQLESRMAALVRQEIALQAKAAVANEQRLIGQPGSPRVVAVLPFTFSGPDTSLKPLERGFAELITTDLSRVDTASLKVVERSRLQAILNEIQLGTTGAADPATRLRAGRLLQAGRLVGGQLTQQGQTIRADATVIDVTAGQPGPGATDAQVLDRLFDMEKTIVLQLLQSLNVPITTALRNAIEQRPTRSMAAFLAYSRGLEYEDRGQFDEASRMFQDASRLDPSFGAAAQKSQETRSAAAGVQVSASSVEASLAGSAEGNVVASATQASTTMASGGLNTAAATAGDLNPSAIGAATSAVATTAAAPPPKDAGSGTGADNPTTRTARVVIVIKPPL